MRLYKIYVGGNWGSTSKNKGPITTLDADVANIVNTLLQAATIHQATGYWEGTAENTKVIEILDTENNLEDTVNTLAKTLKTKLEQDSVMITTEEVNASFI